MIRRTYNILDVVDISCLPCSIPLHHVNSFASQYGLRSTNVEVASKTAETFFISSKYPAWILPARDKFFPSFFFSSRLARDLKTTVRKALRNRSANWHLYGCKQQMNWFCMSCYVGFECVDILFLAHSPSNSHPILFQPWASFRTQSGLVLLDLLPELIDCPLTLRWSLLKSDIFSVLRLVEFKPFDS